MQTQDPSIFCIYVRFYNGYGLGRLLARLFEERFPDVAGTQGMVAVWQAVEALEKVACSSHPNRSVVHILPELQSGFTRDAFHSIANENCRTRIHKIENGPAHFCF